MRLTITTDQNLDGKQPKTGDSLDEFHVSMVLRQFYPHMTGVVTQYRQLGPELLSRQVRLVVHTAQTALAPEASGTLEGITILRSKVVGEGEEARGNEMDARLLSHASACWKQEGNYPDVVVVFGITLKMAPHLLALKRKGVRLILALTIFPEFEDNSPWYTGIKWSIETFVLLNLFDAIVVYSTTFVKLYAATGISKKRLHVLPFPVDCRRFKSCSSNEEKRQLRENLGLTVEGEIIVFMGSVIQRKGADLLLEAWLLLERRHPKAKLVFVGPYGPRDTLFTEALRTEHHEFLQRFQKLLDQLENRDSVVLTNTVDNPQDYLKAADIFAFPSLLEGMGGVIPEAMACNLPCVLTKFEGFPEVEFGEPGKTFLQTDFSPVSIANNIERLLNSPEERQRMGENARRNALEVFDLSLIADKFAAVCRSGLTKAK